jgi:phosphoribosylformylglycinamidine synthase
LGGSEYLKVIHAREQGSPPLLNMDTEKALHECVLALVRGGLVQSAHDCSDGGVAVTLAESCFSGPDRKLGAVIKLSPGRLRKDAVLFGESQSRVVLSAKPVHRQAIFDHAKRLGVPAEVIGSVAGDRLTISLGDATMVDVPVTMLHDRWSLSIERTLNQA